MKKKGNAIMLADTRPALVGTVLLQLQKTNPGLFEEALIYYTEEISERDRAIMDSIIPCRFIHYAPPLPQSLFAKPRFERFSILMFCRYEMFSYLDEYETITWLDTDILIQGDISDLIISAQKTGAAFIREDPLNKTSESPDYMRTCFTETLSGFQNDSYLYCSGTIVLSQKITGFQSYTQWCYEKTVEWANILSLPDQGVINALIQAFNIKVTPVLGKKYCCYPGVGRDCSEAKIVHAWGSNKFWNDWYNYQNFPVWGEFYEDWKAQGGSPLAIEILPLISVIIPVYKPNLEQLQQCLDSLRNQNRDNWERFSDFEILIVAEPFEQEKLQELTESYHDARIQLIINEQRLGIAASLNKGIRLAKGKYIARADDDDICANNRLFLQMQYLQEHPEINLCTSDFEYFGDMNERRVSFEGEMSRAWSIFTCPFNHPTILFDRNFFVKNNLFYDETRSYVEDWELWLRAYQKGMKVGRIHEVLYYHRWINSRSAGQTSKTIDMMRGLVQKNFRVLGVDIPTEDLKIIGPWNGRLLDENDIHKLQNYLSQALENNRLKRLYDQECLERAFSLRMEEAKTGRLPGLSISTQKNVGEEIIAGNTSPYKPNWFRRLLKAFLKPFYRPIKRRYEDRIVEMQTSIWRSEGHLLNCVAKLDQIIARQQQQITQLQKDLELTKLELQTQLSDDIWQTGQYVVSTLSEYEQNFSQNLCSEIEKTQQDLSQRLCTETEKIRQELLGKLHTEAENTRTIFRQANNALTGRIETVSDRAYDVGLDTRFIQGLMWSQFSAMPKVFLIGTPEHSNIGDAAITLGERKFFHEYFPAYSIIELSTYDFTRLYKKIATLICDDDWIFLQGGGNLGNRFLTEEKARRKVISDFPNNRIVIFPQTIYFDDNEEGQKELRISREIYNRHGKLTILTRGRKSTETARKNFTSARIFNALDMALTLQFSFHYDRTGILLCIRNLNDESGLSLESYEQLIKMCKSLDPNCVLTNNLNEGKPEANIYREMRYEVVVKELQRFASHRVVVTDRLHGMIFAVITHTPCVLIRAFNQKIAEFYEFFRESNAIFFIDQDIEQLPNAIEKAMVVQDIEYPVLRNDYFERLYHALVEK